MAMLSGGDEEGESSSTHRKISTMEQQLRAMEAVIADLRETTLRNRIEQSGNKQSGEGSVAAKMGSHPHQSLTGVVKEWATNVTFFRVLRWLIFLALWASSAYVAYTIVLAWLESGREPSAVFSLQDVDSLALPSAGMIPAPYATDSRCFHPKPLSCRAYFGEASSNAGDKRTMNCMSWLSSVNISQRGQGDTLTIHTLDGVKAATMGYWFTSILDFVEYSFEFPSDCTEPYLWVFVSGDTRMVTQARLDPSLSMKSFAQSSFLIQGGQYVMVAFSIQQDIDLSGSVTNTSQLTVSSMMVSEFNSSLSRQATTVFRPASFKLQQTAAQPGQTVWEMIANLGGWIGFFLGFSLLHVIRAAELFHSWLSAKELPTDHSAESEDL
jgi:hypothetical protein